MAVNDVRRGRRGRSWTLITTANHYASRLPALHGGELYKLVTPRRPGARFAEFLVELHEGGSVDPCGVQREHFLYVLQGVVLAGEEEILLQAGGYAYRPPGNGLGFRASGAGGSRVLWVQRSYEPWADVKLPLPVHGHRDDAPFTELEVPGLSRRELLDGDDPSMDFSMSLLRFSAGTALDRVEIHDEEHGLYMTSGAGSYELDGERHAVQADDFIYMGPYCPQWFQASEAGLAEYLLYKDVNRDGF